MIIHEDKQFYDMRYRPYGLAKRAMRNFRNGECEICIVSGMPEGVGKSAYVNHALADVCGYQECHDWEKIKWMFPAKRFGTREIETPIWETDYEATKGLIHYLPEDVVTWLWGMRARGERVPMWHWDDGGTHLNAMEYHDPFVKAFMEFLPLARSVCGLVVISTPVEEWVLKKLRTAYGMIHAPVIRTRDDTHFWKPRGCEAYVMKRNSLKYRPFPDRQWIDDFTGFMPDDFYDWYKPRRDGYATLAIEKMAAGLKRKREADIIKGVLVDHDISKDSIILQSVINSVDRPKNEMPDISELVENNTEEDWMEITTQATRQKADSSHQ